MRCVVVQCVTAPLALAVCDVDVQGGFAKCYAFTLVAKNRALAGKVIAKANLVKARAKQKVSGGGACVSGAYRGG